MAFAWQIDVTVDAETVMTNGVGFSLKDNIFEKLKSSQRPLLLFSIQLFQSSFLKSTKHSSKRKLNLFESAQVTYLWNLRPEKTAW